MLLDLNKEILQIILDGLDTHALAAVAQTSRLLNVMVQRMLSFVPPLAWTTHETPFTACVPPDEAFQHVQCMARTGHIVWLPYLGASPQLYAHDTTTKKWHVYPIQIAVTDEGNYTPFFAPVVAVGSLLYMFGGQQVLDSRPINHVHVLDTCTHVLARIHPLPGTHPPPRARVFHSLNVWRNRFLIVFAGLCSDASGENDLMLFDTETMTWQVPNTCGHSPFVRFGHSSTMIGNNLYIFGGQADQEVYDVLYSLDCDSWTWFKHDRPEAVRYRRHLPRKELQDSLHRDLVIETTGQPPRDRFHGTMCAVNTKLLFFGGLTILQDDHNRNVIRTYTMRRVDIYDVWHQHWSTIICKGSDVCLYGMTCFVMDKTVHAFGCRRMAIAESTSDNMWKTGDDLIESDDDDLRPGTHCAVMDKDGPSPTNASIPPYVHGTHSSTSSFSSSSSEVLDIKPCYRHVAEPWYMTLALQHE